MKTMRMIVLAILCFQNCMSQTIESLKLNTSIEKNFAAGQVHLYSVLLRKDDFAAINIVQESIGLGYKVFAPNDSLIIFADLNSMYQTEIVPIHATKNGNYRIEVFWDYSSRESKGKYSVMLATLERDAQTPAKKANQLLGCFYKSDEPGAAVAVIENGKPVFKFTHGLADIGRSTPIHADMKFDLASCSKQFTGYAIALLLKEKKLDLKDDIRKYVPEVPDFGSTIKIEHLIAHTSGLRNWDEVAFMAGYRDYDIIDLPLVLKMLSTQTQLNFMPGERFSYSNTGYSLLSLIVERVSQMPFQEFCWKKIFEPLNMQNTTVKIKNDELITNIVYSYKKSVNGSFVKIPNSWAVPGSSSVHSSLNDLIKWVNHLDYTIDPEVSDILETKFLTNAGDTIQFYSFGNFFNMYRGQNRIEHLGLVLGYRIAIARFPDLKKSIIYLSNDANDATYNYYMRITDSFLPDFQEVPIKDVPLPELEDYLKGNFIDDMIPLHSQVDISGYAGVYYSPELNASFKVEASDSTFYIDFSRLGKIYLQYLPGENQFRSIDKKWKGFLRFEKKNDGKINGFYLTNGVLREFWCEKVN